MDVQQQQPPCESEGKLSVIDMQSLPDWKYTYILCYQDRISRILILHAIETRLPSEIAFILCDILHLLGTPAFIRSENGNAFVTRVLRELKAIWPSCNFCIQPQQQQQQQQSPEDEDLFASDYMSNVCVLENLRAWMSKHNSSNWSLGLKLVQFQENSRNYLEQFEFMFDYKFPVELAETLMPFEALGCLKTKQELNQILEESITTAIENVHSALAGSSSYGVMYGDSDISEGPKYHSLGRTRKKRLVYNGNFTIGKSRNNKLSVVNIPQLSSECSGSKTEPACIKDGGLPLSTDVTSPGCSTDKGAFNKKRLCIVKKSELKRFEIQLFPESCKNSDDNDQPENINDEKLGAEEKFEIDSNRRELSALDSLKTKCDLSLVNSSANMSSNAIPECEPSELRMTPVKDIIKFMESQCCKVKTQFQKPRIKIEKPCESLTGTDVQPLRSNQLDAENNVVTVGKPAQTFHRSYKNLSPEFCRRICVFDSKVEFKMPSISKELIGRQGSRRQSNSCLDCRPCQLFQSENSTAKDPDRINGVDHNPSDPAKDPENPDETDNDRTDLTKGENKSDLLFTDSEKTSSTAGQDSERDHTNSMVENKDQNLPPRTETKTMDCNNFKSGVSSDSKSKELCDLTDTDVTRRSNECGKRQSGNFQDSLCLLNVKAIINKLETKDTRCSSCENLSRRTVAVERAVGVRDIIKQLESFSGPHPKWRTLQIIQNRDETKGAVQSSRKNSSAFLLDNDSGDSAGLPFLDKNNNSSDDDDKDVDENDTDENDDSSSSSDSDLDKTPTNEDMADSLHDSGFGVLEETIPRDYLTEEKSDEKVSDVDDPKRAPPLGEVLQSSDASDDVFSFTEDVEQRLNTVIFRLKSESDMQDSEVEELEDYTTELGPEKESGSDTKVVFRDLGFGVRRPLKGLRCNSCSLLTNPSRSNLNKNRSFSTECVIHCYASEKDEDEDRTSILFKPQIFKLDCNGTGEQAGSKYHYTVTHKGRSWYIPGYENPPCVTNSDDEGIEVEFVTDIENDIKEALDGLDSLNLERHGSQENVCTPAVCSSVREEHCSFVLPDSCIWDHSSDTGGDNLCVHCHKRIHKMCGIREKPHEEHCYLLCPVCHVVEKSLLVQSPPDKSSWQKPKQIFEKRNILRGKSFYAIETKPYCEPCYVNTLEKCSVCSKPVIDRLLRATGKPYHPACFTCVVCGMSLDGVPFTVDATNQIHCIEDFHKKFAPRCCVCQHPIMPDPGKEETVRVVAMDRSFHVQCYCCEDCGMLLSSEAEGRGCYPLDDHILCKHCNAKRIQALTTKMATEP